MAYAPGPAPTHGSLFTVAEVADMMDDVDDYDFDEPIMDGSDDNLGMNDSEEER